MFVDSSVDQDRPEGFPGPTANAGLHHDPLPFLISRGSSVDQDWSQDYFVLACEARP